MRKSWMIGVLGAAALAVVLAGTGPAIGAMSEKEKAQKEPYPNDLGPEAIDVAAYPPEMQAKYKLFVAQCSQCHLINRPINSQFNDADTWKRYVKRMMSKPGCTITKGKDIYEFLTYDSKIRKIAHKAEWKKHRVNLLTQFKAKYPDRYTLLFESRSPEAEAAKELPGW